MSKYLSMGLDRVDVPPPPSTNLGLVVSYVVP
jgi:hypothetical protein